MEDQKQPKYINNSLVTRIVSGEPISLNGKDDNNVLIPYATMIMSVNDVINFKEIGLHITDRVIVVPFLATFTDDRGNRDINIGDKLCTKEALKIIVTRAIQAFEKVLEVGRFTIPPIVEQETKRYFMECNSALEFARMFPIKTIIVKSTYYKKYSNWCRKNNREAVSDSQFGKQLKAIGYRPERYLLGGKREQFYASPDFDNSKSKDIYNEYLQWNGITKETDKIYGDKYKRENYNGTFEDYLCKQLDEEEKTDNEETTQDEQKTESQETASDNT